MPLEDFPPSVNPAITAAIAAETAARIAADALKVAKAGDTMSGTLDMGTNLIQNISKLGIGAVPSVATIDIASASDTAGAIIEKIYNTDAPLNGNGVRRLIDLKNSANARTTFIREILDIVSKTAGAEVGRWTLDLINAGALETYISAAQNLISLTKNVTMNGSNINNLADPLVDSDGDTRGARNAAIAAAAPTFNGLILKDFFSDNSLMPATTFKEAKYVWPTTDFTNLDGGAISTVYGSARVDSANNKVATFGWDIGSLKSKLLLVVGGIRSGTGEVGIFFSNTTPGSSEVADGTYLFLMNSTACALYKRNGGAFTLLDNNTKSGIQSGVDGTHIGLALYYDDATGTIQTLIRNGTGVWIGGNLVTGESTFTTMRYCGIRVAAIGTPTFYAECPIAIYYTT